MPLVNTNFYPTKTNLTTSFFYISYSLAELYDKDEYGTTTELIETELPKPGEGKLDTSNVYGWMDENCVYMRRSNIAVDLSTATMTQIPLDNGAANLRMMYHASTPTPIIPLPYYDIAPNLCAETSTNSLYYVEGNTTTNPTGTTTRWFPINRLKYEDYILYIRFIICTIDSQTDSLGRWAVPYSDLSQGYVSGTQMLTSEEVEELFSKGWVYGSLVNNGLITLAGITITPYCGSIEAETDTRSSDYAFFPFAETNCGDAAWIGTLSPSREASSTDVSVNGLVYYDSNWINNSIYNVNYEDGSPELMSLSIFNWSKDFLFGATNDFTIDMVDFEGDERNILIEGNFAFSKYRTISGATNILPVFTFEECMNMAASYGLYFTLDETKVNEVLGQDLTSNDIYLGKMYENGRCDGTYTQGAATKAEPQAQDDLYIVTTRETDNTMEGVEPIDPSEPYVPPGPEPEDDPLPVETEERYTGDPTLVTVVRDAPQGGVKYYTLNSTELAAFILRLWDQPKSFYEALQIAGKQTNSIFDYINSIRYFPINYDWKGGGVEPVTMGTGAVLKEADSDENYELYPVKSIKGSEYCGRWDLSESKYHWRENYQFLNHSPYLKISIYLPYVGTIELSPEQIASFTDINQTGINLSAYFDIPSGSITYRVYNDDNLMLVTKTAKVAIDLPLSGNDATTQAAAILNAQLNTAKTILGAVENVAGTNVKGLLKAGGKVAVAGAVLDMAAQGLIGAADLYIQNSLAHKMIPVEVSSFGGASLSNGIGMVPYITIYRQKTANPSNYGHTVGYLTEEAYQISSLSGFTVCKNVDIKGISQATDKEKAQIKQILESGFYA